MEAYRHALVPEYRTQDSAEVAAEIEALLGVFEDVKVENLESGLPTVTVPTTHARKGKHRPRIEIVVVPGYPFVAPRINLCFPSGVKPGDAKCPFTAADIPVLQKVVQECAESCRAAGTPCMMPVLNTANAAIAELFESPQSGGAVPVASSESAKASPKLGPQQRPSGGAAPGGKAAAAAATSQPPSPALTPIPMKAKDAFALGVLALHMLKKCCDLKTPESRDEAAGNFSEIAEFLFSLGILPESARRALPWRPDTLRKVFSSTIARVEAEKQQSAAMKWFWESTEARFGVLRGSEGRYRREFIENRLVGSGGFAPVYVCRKALDNRNYAIKKIPICGNHYEKIIREVQTLSLLNDRNVVRYYDAWVEDGCDEELKRFIESDDDEEEEEEEEEQEDSSASKSTEGFEEGEEEETGSSSSSTSLLLLDSTTSSESTSTGTTAGGDQRGKPAKRYQTLYIQMELCSARSLRHLIESGESEGGQNRMFVGGGGERVAASILRQLLTVMSHMHRDGIVHRDLKPDNVLFEETNTSDDSVGTIRVADFGLARVMTGVRRNESNVELDAASAALRRGDVSGGSTAGSSTGGRLTTGLGSVLYCAPEQRSGGAYGVTVDEFSIGMIALEMWLVIGGKDFRERFLIMSDVWHTGTLPEWFVKWKPVMAGVIARLVRPNPDERATCDEILATADLPGDAAELSEALSVVERYGDEVWSRIVRRYQREARYTRPTAQEIDVLNARQSLPALSVVNTVHMIGVIEGLYAHSALDPLVLMTAAVSDLGEECVVGASGKLWSHSRHPHIAVATHVGLADAADTGPFYCFYTKARSFAVFVAPLSPHDLTQLSDFVFQPTLSLLHLLTCVDWHAVGRGERSAAPVRIVFSRARWFNFLFPVGLGSRAVPADVAAVEVGTDGGGLSAALEEMDGRLGVDHDAEEVGVFVRYILGVADALSSFGGSLAANVQLVVDPNLQPNANLVNSGFLEDRFFFECQVSGRPLAFGCFLNNFTRRCLLTRSEVNGFIVNVDVQELAQVERHMRVVCRESVQLDGVCVRPQQYHTSTRRTMQAAVELWKCNVRACLRSDVDPRRVLKEKGLRWMLLDGHSIASAAAQGKGPRGRELQLEEVVPAVRALAASHKTAGRNVAACALFAGAEQRQLTPATELYRRVAETPLEPDVLVCEEASAQLEEAFRRAAADGKARLPDALARWLDAHPRTAVLPVYCLGDRRLLLFCNPYLFPCGHDGKKSGNGGDRKDRRHSKR